MTRRFLGLFLLILSVMFFPQWSRAQSTPPDNWWNVAWAFRIPVTFSLPLTSAASLSGDTVDVEGVHLVSLINMGKMQMAAADLRVIDDQGQEIPYVVENYENDCDQDRIWLKLDHLNPGDTRTFFLYFGNPTASKPSYSWNDISSSNTLQPDANTLVLYNFDNQTDLFADESGNGYAAETFPDRGVPSWTPQGRHGGGLFFTESGQFIDVSHKLTAYLHDNYPQGSPWTIEFWFRPSKSVYFASYGTFGPQMLTGNYAYAEGLTVRNYWGMGKVEGGFPSGLRLTGDLTVGEWHHAALVFDGLKSMFYLNGQKVGEKSSSIETIPSVLSISLPPPMNFVGVLDDFRISNIARTDFPYTTTPTVSLGKTEEITNTSFRPEHSFQTYEAECFRDVSSSYFRDYYILPAVLEPSLVSKGMFVSSNGPFPTVPKPIYKDVDISQSGSYRVWLRYRTTGYISGLDLRAKITVTQSGRSTEKVILTHPANFVSFAWEPVDVELEKGTARITIETFEKGRQDVDVVLVTKDPSYLPDYSDFSGLTYMRWTLQNPQGHHYWVDLRANTNPYSSGPIDMGFYGKPGKLDKEPTDDNQMLGTGEWSGWVEMPATFVNQGYVVFELRDRDGLIAQTSADVEFQFANKPYEESVLHTSIVSTGAGRAPSGYFRSIEIRMPQYYSSDTVADTKTFEEWSTFRYQKFQEVVGAPVAGPRKFPITTWWMDTMFDKTSAMVDNDLNVLGGMGINALGNEELPSYIIPFTKEQYRDRLRMHGIKYFAPSDWAVNLQYKGLDISWHPGETLRDWLRRLHETYYQQQAAARVGDWIFDNIYRVTMADEIQSVFTAQGGMVGTMPWFGINTVPQIHDEFVKYLQGHGLVPEFFGSNSWGDVLALDQSNGSYNNLDLIGKHRWYWTKRFISYVSSSFFWREASEAIQKYFPSKPFTTFNLQANPIQGGMMWDGSFDVFEAGYERASTFLFTEDWNTSDDFGFAQKAFGMDILRGAGRLHGQPYGGYLVGFSSTHPVCSPQVGSSRAAAYSYLAQGVSSLDYYLYGPVSNIGPAWGENPEAMKVLSQVNSEVAKVEDILMGSHSSPSQTALLVANTSEINEPSGGNHFGKERQAVYAALRQAGISVDLIGEDQIARDDVLRRYKVLFIVDPHIRHDVQESIKDWVARGGFLWAESGSGMWNEYDQPSDVLNHVLGVSRQTIVQQPNFPKIDEVNATIGGATFSTSVWGERSVVTVLQKRSIKVLGRFASDGSPAIILNRYLGGGAMLVGFFAGETYLRAHWPQTYYADGVPYYVAGQDLNLGLNERKLITGIVDDHGADGEEGLTPRIHRDLEVSQPGLLSSVRKNDTGWVVFLVNGPLRHVNTVTVTVKGARAKGFTSAESAALGSIGFSYQGDDLVFSIPLDEADMVALRGGNRIINRIKRALSFSR